MFFCCNHQGDGCEGCGGCDLYAAAAGLLRPGQHQRESDGYYAGGGESGQFLSVISGACFSMPVEMLLLVNFRVPVLSSV